MTDPDPRPARFLVWDLATRVLHWMLAASFVAAFAVASLADEHSPRFALHMLLGAVAAFVAVLRIAWGLFGSKHARFASFAHGPGAVIRYLRGALAGGGEAYAGHNPANAWAAIAMLALTIGLAATGVLMSRGGHAVKEVHEALAYAMIGVVGAHLAGLAWHTIRTRENIALGMIDGKKIAAKVEAIGSAHPAAALVFVALTFAWAGSLVRGYDPASRRVTILGQAVQLGEGDERPHGEKHRERRRGGHREHHDD